MFRAKLIRFHMHKNRFSSLNEAVNSGAKICVSPIVVDDLIIENPGAEDYLNSTTWSNSTQLLDALDRDECDSIILSNNEFQSEFRAKAEICDNFAILQDNVLLTLPVVFPVGSNLGTVGDELIYQMNRMIDDGWFGNIYDEITKDNPSVCAEKLEQPKSSSVTVFQILLPAIISIVSSFIALCISFKHQRQPKEILSRTGVESEPLVGSSRLSEMSGIVLYKFLSTSKNIDPILLAKAANDLPNKTRLLELAYSDYNRQERLRDDLIKLSDVELLDIIIGSATFPLEGDLKVKFNNALASVNRQHQLIEIILNTSGMTASAIMSISQKSWTGLYGEHGAILSSENPQRQNYENIILSEFE